MTVPRRLSELYLWLVTVPLLVMVQVGFSAADLQRIGRENALALLPRLNRA